MKSPYMRSRYGCNLGKFSSTLSAPSDTFPAEVNLQDWDIQCVPFCGSFQTITAHVLGGCTTALTQHHFTYHHNQVLAIEVSMLFTGLYVSL